MGDESTQVQADVAVVGAGPAGMMAAIAAAERGRRVVVLEQLQKAGAKLLATGGGRCNLTHALEARDFLARFARRGPFLRPAMAEIDPAGLREFFHVLGVETVREASGQVYPASQSAATVQQALVGRCRQLGVRFLFRSEAKELLVEDGAVRGLRGGGGAIRAPRVVLATGGRSYPSLGGTGGGYALARQAGHTILEPLPALVDLRTRETWPARCAGLSVPAARVRIDLPGASRRGAAGDVLFTHAGISGPAVLDLSGDVVELLGRARPGGERRPEVPLRLELVPGTTAPHWRRRLEEWRQALGRRSVALLLADHLPARLAEAVCGLASVGPQARAAHLDSRQRHALAEALAGVRLTAVASGGFESAMVTRGGVCLQEVDARTLQSRLAEGLFLAGEVLDVDGPCGGFNLQWAFSSGRLAGASAST